MISPPRRRRSNLGGKMLYDGDFLSHGEVPSTGWEYVLAFLAPDIAQLRENYSSSTLVAASRARASTLQQLRDAEFSYSQLWVPALRAVLVRVALPEKTLRKRAEDRGIELQLHRRFGGGFLEFKQERANYYVNQGYKDYFTPAERLRITIDVVGSSAKWGAGIDVEHLKHVGVLMDAYPVHDRVVRKSLLKHSVFERWWDPLYQPSLTRLKDYFGTRMTLYFAFLGFFRRMLVGISVLSIPVYYILNADIPRNLLLFVRFLYGTGLVFWGTYFLKYWKRRNAILNVKWGTDDFYEDSYNEVRPQYIGASRLGFYSQGGFVSLDDLSTNPTMDDTDSEESDDGMENVIAFVRRRFREDADFQLGDDETGTVLPNLPSFPYCDKKQLRRRMSFSVFMTLLFTVVMMSLTFLIIFYTAEMIEYFDKDRWGPVVPGVLLGILIFICDNGWKLMSERLSKWENHRTSQSYQNSGIIKRFAFQFVSNYFSLFYIAFIKPYTPDDPCVLNPVDGKPDCMMELQTQLASLVITKATIQQLLELGIPSLIVLVKRVKMWWDARRSRRALRQPLLQRDDDDEDVNDIEESKLANYRNTIEDYGELVIQFGYIALFGLVYPPAALVCLINNMIEMRSDAFKILFISKRVPADDAADIGKWLDMLKLISGIAVWTNAGLLMFTSNRGTSVVSDVSLKVIVIFFVFEHVLLWVKKGIENSVNDVPGKTYRRRARQDYLIYRWFKIGEKPNYSQNMTAQLDLQKSTELDPSLNTDLLAALESEECSALKVEEANV